jgi:hypothetical protein
MTSKRQPKPRLRVIDGGIDDLDSIGKLLRDAVEEHKKRPFEEMYLVTVLQNHPHGVKYAIRSHSLDRVRLLGTLQLAMREFLARYF